MSDVLKKAKQLTALKESLERAKLILARKEKTESKKTVPAQNEMPDAHDTQYKSKLVICIEVLCTLVANGPMKMPQLVDRFKMDEARLAPHLRLLWDRGLIEEEQFNNETHYVVTERGLTVLKVINPLIREAHKFQMRNFEVITSMLSGAGYS